jgi:hypothetical protein
MQEKNYTGIIPSQESGAAVEAMADATFQTTEEAQVFFQEARKRLLHINEWHKIAGNLSATFYLTDKDGKEIEGAAKEGYYLKIDIPGPGTATGMGYDWVIIEAVESISTPGIESIGIRVRPASNPMNSDKDVAHFYSTESTSSFTVTREMNKVTAAIYDRNTQTNTDASTITDKIRDAIVGIGGIAAFSKVQWKMLAEGLVKQH